MRLAANLKVWLESFLDPWILDCNMTRVCNTSNNSMVIHLKSDPILKVILKYHKHPCILTIKEKCKSNSRFPFSYENRNSDTCKGSQDNDIQPVIKENSGIFTFHFSQL